MLPLHTAVLLLSVTMFRIEITVTLRLPISLLQAHILLLRNSVTLLDVMVTPLNVTVTPIHIATTVTYHCDLVTSYYAHVIHNCATVTYSFALVFTHQFVPVGDRGNTVVKVLCYKSEGRWFDPR